MEARSGPSGRHTHKVQARTLARLDFSVHARADLEGVNLCRSSEYERTMRAARLRCTRPGGRAVEHYTRNPNQVRARTAAQEERDGQRRHAPNSTHPGGGEMVSSLLGLPALMVHNLWRGAACAFVVARTCTWTWSGLRRFAAEIWLKCRKMLQQWQKARNVPVAPK